MDSMILFQVHSSTGSAARHPETAIDSNTPTIATVFVDVLQWLTGSLEAIGKILYYVLVRLVKLMFRRLLATSEKNKLSDPKIQRCLLLGHDSAGYSP